MLSIKPFVWRGVLKTKKHKNMIEEEKIIRQHDSGRNPFRTPDGYFENFTDKLMARIAAEAPQQAEPVKARVVALPLWRRAMRYAAAVVAAVVCVGGGTLLYNRLQTPDQLMNGDALEYAWDDDELEDILDYEMVDNNQIAYYLTEAY